MSTKKSLVSKIFTPPSGDVIYPVTDIIFGPYLQFIKTFKLFFWTASLYSLLLTILYLIMGQSVFCNFSLFSREDICSNNAIIFIITRLLAFYLIAAFGVRYYQLQWQHIDINWKYLLMPTRRDVISFFVLIILILVNFIAVWSWKTLVTRIPNPNWKIELTYFAVIASGFLVPLILMRLYVIIAFVFSGIKKNSLFDIWKKTQGNNLRLLVGFSLLFFISVVFLSVISGNLSAQSSEAGWFSIISGEYIFNFSLLIVFGFFVNSCGIQKSYLCKEKEND